MNFYISLLTFLVFYIIPVDVSGNRWQQRADYYMEVELNVETHQYAGTQIIEYVNNSPDTLYKLFYHLYMNAFQPGSLMDIRSRTISDPDPRVGDRIFNLRPDEIGYLSISDLTIDGKKCEFIIHETIMEVKLDEPIYPGSSVRIELLFRGQVPVQIRRNGRNSKEGIAYSMAQWYPKLCEYDFEGWHANPYIGREFHGVWGNFDVKIRIDKSYILGASGVLQNAEEIGYGYSEKEIDHRKARYKNLVWHFRAENVHDFVWAADPKYKHEVLQTEEGVDLHFLYVETDRTEKVWKELPGIMAAALKKFNDLCGKYPYPVYSFIQGGDGGMEYPMATLITGERNLHSLVGVSLHEWAHSWYHLILATNESRHPWMDEGFTSWAENIVFNSLAEDGVIPGAKPKERTELFSRSFEGYKLMLVNGLAEPLSTHADHYSNNTIYGVNSYSKGALYLNQLSYILGEEVLREGLLAYFERWKFQHPDPNDFIRVMEKISGMELRWYNEYWIYTNKYIDYSVDSLYTEISDNNKTKLILRRAGEMPMPLDISITLTNGEIKNYYIPLNMLFGQKKKDLLIPEGFDYFEAWNWVDPLKIITLDFAVNEIQKIEIDPSKRMADLFREDNVWPRIQ